MAKISRFEDIESWKLSRELAKKTFELTKDGDFGKDFRFRDQIRASIGSTMDNIAEGFERGGNREFIQFLSIAKASVGEFRSQLYRALDFGYISKEEFEKMTNEATTVGGKIGNFMQYLKNSDRKGSKFN